MGINNLDLKMNKSTQAINRQRNAINILLNNKKAVSIKSNNKDLYIKGSSSNINDNIGLYVAPRQKVIATMSEDMVDMLNFNYESCWKYTVSNTPDNFIFDGIVYPKAMIPDINMDKCLDIKAEDNSVIFERGKYYKFADENGNFHILGCTNNSLMMPYSYTCRGITDKVSNSVGKFWGLLSFDATYISMYYSENKQRQFLNDAGITEGFFSVQVGEAKREYYLSNGTRGTIVSKETYERGYNMLVNDSCMPLRDYEAGSIFRIAGKEYVLREDKTLDIPYGVDIFDELGLSMSASITVFLKKVARERRIPFELSATHFTPKAICVISKK